MGRRRRAAPEPGDEDATAERGGDPAVPAPDHWHDPVRGIATIALVAAFVWAMPRLGFYVAVALFVPLLTVILGPRRPLVSAAFIALFIAGVYLVFELLLDVSFPEGLLG